MRYLANRSRCLDGMNDTQVEEVVLRILETREAVNKKGGRKFQKKSLAAKSALKTKKISRSFFLMLRSKYPELRKKIPKKVDINRGFNVTKDMAIEYLDELAAEINAAGIGKLEYVGPGVWNGPVDTRRIVVHDETPQMINHGDSSFTKTRVFGVCGERCETLTKSNRDCVTVQPFSNLAGETLVTQVIFSGACLTSHMAPASTNNIPNLLVSANKAGVTNHETLLSAYKELDRELTKESIPRPVIIIADGHSSRFGEAVLEFLQAALLYLFILHPDTSGGTQLHDQMNAKLHALYDEKKALIYSSVSTLNRECFMNILSEAWPEFATPSLLVKAARRVGLSSEGLNINWMNQEMFKRADYLMHGPATPAKESSAVVISSPIGVRKHSLEYYKQKYELTSRTLQELIDTPVSLKDVDVMLPMKKIQPKKSKAIRMTQVHGSMRASDILTKVKERNAVEAAKLKKKNDAVKNREKMRLAFIICKGNCQCPTAPKCIIASFKQCPVCLNVIKSQCSKLSCIIDGKKPVMILAPSAIPSAGPSGIPKRSAKQVFKEMAYHDDDEEDWEEDEEESEEEADESEVSGLLELSDDDDQSFDNTVDELVVSDDPMHYDDVLIGRWVIVKYEGEKFIGNVDSKRNGEFLVRCLEKPFGIREPQSYESGEPIYYDEVYGTSAIPTPTRIGRKWLFKY